jgi:hypothetical protein
MERLTQHKRGFHGAGNPRPFNAWKICNFKNVHLFIGSLIVEWGLIRVCWAFIPRNEDTNSSTFSFSSFHTLLVHPNRSRKRTSLKGLRLKNSKCKVMERGEAYPAYKRVMWGRKYKELRCLNIVQILKCPSFDSLTHSGMRINQSTLTIHSQKWGN